MVSQIIVYTLSSTVLCSLSHAAFAFWFRSFEWYKKAKPADAAFAVQTAVSIPLGLILALIYALALWQTPWTVEGRHFFTSDISELGASVHLGLTLYEVVLYVVYGKSLPFWIHHVLTVGATGVPLYTGHMHALIAWQGLAELTNAPLGCITLMQKDSLLRASTAYTIAGGLLWLSFLATRVISLAWAALTISHDLLVGLPELGRDQEITVLLRYAIVPSTLFIWGLSCLWFGKITRGLLKALGYITEKTQ